jgi:hypothetical protein
VIASVAVNKRKIVADGGTVTIEACLRSSSPRHSHLHIGLSGDGGELKHGGVGC